MSHQEADHVRKNLAIIKALFEQLLFPSGTVARHGNAKLDSSWLAAIALTCWGWTASGTMDDRVHAACMVVGRTLGVDATISRQGLMKALRTLGQDFLDRITARLSDHLEQLNGPWTCAGRASFAVDGSKFAAPRTKANQKRFAANGKGKKKQYASKASESKASTVQVLATVIWHMGTGLPLTWRLNSGSGSERLDVEAMLGQLPPRSRLIGDAEFVGYRLWSEIIDSGNSFLVRIGSNVTLLRSLGKYKIKNGFVCYWPEKAMYRRQPPLVLRLIKLRKGRRVIHLLTSELDMSDETARKLYQQRWGVEVFFRTVKQSCARSKLCSCSPDNVLIELNWTILGIWSAMYLGNQQLNDKRSTKTLLSPIKVIRAFYQAVLSIAHASESVQSITQALSTAKRRDESNRKSSKKSRNYPCKRKRRPCGRPKIKSPSQLQKRRFVHFAT